MKILMTAAIAAMLVAGTAFAEEYNVVSDDTTYSEPSTDVVSSESEHGGLPGGENTKWTTDEGDATYTEFAKVEGSDVVVTDTPLLEVNQWTEANSGARTDIAVNPGGNTTGTDRFNADVMLEQQRTATQTIVYELVVTPPPPVTNPADVCKDDGWIDLGFKNQGKCVSSFN